MIIGYARVSKLDQNLDRQLDQLKKEGCERIYQEKMTGTRKDRPELLRMLDAIREGDTIIVCELTRLSRSVKDLFDLVDKINTAKANIRSLKEPWLDTTNSRTANDRLFHKGLGTSFVRFGRLCHSRFGLNIFGLNIF